MAVEQSGAESKPREPAGESPPKATTFRVPLRELGCRDGPQVVAADLERDEWGQVTITVRTPTTTYIADPREETVRQEPLDGEDWKDGRDVDEVPDWLTVVGRYLGMEDRLE